MTVSADTTQYQTLTVATEGVIGQVQLNRPASLNAFNSGMRHELLQALTRLSEDDNVRVVVLGAVGKAFCSGADLAEGLPVEITVEQQILDEYAPILQQIAQMQKPVIAAVNGVMAGIGASLAMQCDLMVMSDSAQLGMAFTNIGLVPDGGACWHLLRYMGYQRAYQLIAEGGRLSAQECQQLGIANRLVPADDVNRVALEWAESLAQRAPVALREVKALLRRAASQSWEQTVVQEAKVQQRCASTEDAREAVTAFMQKRAPVFVGR
ncbi:enoyl-CoA hydratase-related protein [Pseudomaricurvus sp. HS19]|uniref:enoyl-CoA hydratase/isomerase family protein n=1 Tax=Pseudomaricurvus sp. HS19 TaxID=2692626 RepID=UPI0013699B31|nr:enoyl-CoA hydratase/isomerase family protein [Pseudomaricurvus sp. HS19]